MNWQTWFESTAWAGGKMVVYAASFVATWTILAKFWRIASPYKDLMVRWVKAPLLIDGRVSAIEKQFFPNGGSSLIDRIDALGRRMMAAEGNLSSSIRQLDLRICRIQQNVEAEQAANEAPRLHFDENNKLIRANEAALRVLNVPAAEAMGHGWTSKIHSGYIDRITAQMKSAARDCRPTHIDFVVVRTASDGISVTLHLHPLSDDGQFAGWHGSMRITSP